jgi:amidase
LAIAPPGVVLQRYPPPAVDAIIEAGRGAFGSYARRVSAAVQRTLPQYFAVAEEHQKLLRAWRDFTRYDVLRCPITPTVAFPHDTRRADMAALFERSLQVARIAM